LTRTTGCGAIANMGTGKTAGSESNAASREALITFFQR
jgi:hypothetical protein